MPARPELHNRESGLNVWGAKRVSHAKVVPQAPGIQRAKVPRDEIFVNLKAWPSDTPMGSSTLQRPSPRAPTISSAGG